MSDSENKKSRRPLKTLPPDRFQPKMLIFWLALVGAVLAVIVVIGLWGMKIMRDKRRLDEERKSRFKASRKQKL